MGSKYTKRYTEEFKRDAFGLVREEFTIDAVLDALRAVYARVASSS